MPKRQPDVDDKSQFITQMYGTTSVLHPRKKNNLTNENNTSMDLKLLVKQQPDLQHYEHEYNSGMDNDTKGTQSPRKGLHETSPNKVLE